MGAVMCDAFWFGFKATRHQEPEGPIGDRLNYAPPPP